MKILNKRRTANEAKMRKPIPKALSEGEAYPLTIQSTSKTGIVFNVDATAFAAPVSPMQRLKTRTAPEKTEYFVKGKVILLKIVKGFAPNVLATSSISGVTLSMAAAIDKTK
jgi:hypothetical protein